MKKIFALVFTLLTIQFSAWAQTNYEDVVYLKNGSIIHGIIIEQIPNVSIKIKSGSNIFVYQMEEIEKLTREEIKEESPEKKKTPKSDDFVLKPKGFSASYEMGVLYYGNGDNGAMFALMLVNGYRFNPHFSLGLGVGVEANSGDFYNIPVYIDARGYAYNKKFTPYFSLAGGINSYTAKYVTGVDFSGTHSTSKTRTGFMFNPSIGGQLALSPKVAWGFNLGYKVIQTPILIYGTNYQSSTKYATFHCLTARTGIAF